MVNEGLETTINELPDRLNNIIINLNYDNPIEIISFSNVLIQLGMDISTRLLLDSTIENMDTERIKELTNELRFKK